MDLLTFHPGQYWVFSMLFTCVLNLCAGKFFISRSFHKVCSLAMYLLCNGQQIFSQHTQRNCFSLWLHLVFLVLTLDDFWLICNSSWLVTKWLLLIHIILVVFNSFCLSLHLSILHNHLWLCVLIICLDGNHSENRKVCILTPSLDGFARTDPRKSISPYSWGELCSAGHQFVVL